MSLPPINAIPSLPTEERAAILDTLFEQSTALHTLGVELLHTQTFESYHDLIASVGIQLSELAESASTSDTKWLDSILSAYPRLGADKIGSAESRKEQNSLQSGPQEEAGKLRALNDRYEAIFPSLVFLTFVNGRSRSEIMIEMQARIDRNDATMERTNSIRAVCEIAADRAQKLT